MERIQLLYHTLYLMLQHDIFFLFLKRFIIVDWLLHLYPPITRKRRWSYPLDETPPAQKLTIFPAFHLTFDFFQHKFSACSEPPSRDNHRKRSYPRTQQRDQGASWTHDHAIKVVVKTTPLLAQKDSINILHFIDRVFWYKNRLRTVYSFS